MIISLRSLPDIFVSERTKMLKKGVNSIDWRVPGLIDCCPNFEKLSEESQYDYFIKFIAPWYIRFFTSWMSLEDQIDIKYVCYDQHTEHVEETLLDLCKFCGIQPDPQGIKNVVRLDENSTKATGNSSGQGLQKLNSHQISELEALLDFHEVLRGSKLRHYLLYGNSIETVHPIRKKNKNSSSENQRHSLDDSTSSRPFVEGFPSNAPSS